MVVDMDGPPCQGNCPNWGCLEAVASGSALVREAALRVAREPDTPLGLALEDGRPLTGPLVTEMAFDGDPVAAESIRVIGERLGVGIANLVNIFNPEVVVIGGGVIAAGELLLEPAREVMQAARARARPRPRPRRRDDVRRGVGHDRRGAAGGRPGGGGVSGAGGRLVVCPTPIGNLEDVTLRVLAALRDADLIACEDTRRTRVLLERYGVQATLLSYHEHNERERTPELVARMLDGAVVALVSDAGMPLVSDPGYVLVAGCIAAGLEVEVLPGPSAAIAALVASGLPADRWRFAGFLPRKRGALEALLAAPETRRRVRVAAARRRLARGARRARPGAARRGLPRADEAARGGRPRRRRDARGALREHAAARRGRARHRRRAAAQGRRPGRDRGRAAAGRGGRARAAGGGRRRGADRRRRQRSVPRGDERRTSPQRMTPRGRSGARLGVASSRAPLLAVVLVCVALGAGSPRPRRAAWAAPVPGPPTRLFDLGPDPFARGQHRGVDLDAAPGERVRSACGGRVVFAGRVAGVGTVSVRCGAWRVTYAPLERIAVRAGARVGPGRRLGRVGAGAGAPPTRPRGSGVRGAIVARAGAAGHAGLHFGVRREGRRFGYVDPLRFLAGPRRAPPPVLPARPAARPLRARARRRIPRGLARARAVARLARARRC